MNRRHHCRRCGNLVCKSCSKHKKLLSNIDKNKPVRVCNDCHQLLSSQKPCIQQTKVNEQPLFIDYSTKGSSEEEDSLNFDQNNHSLSTLSIQSNNKSSPKKQPFLYGRKAFSIDETVEQQLKKGKNNNIRKGSFDVNNNGNNNKKNGKITKHKKKNSALNKLRNRSKTASKTSAKPLKKKSESPSKKKKKKHDKSPSGLTDLSTMFDMQRSSSTPTLLGVSKSNDKVTPKQILKFIRQYKNQLRVLLEHFARPLMDVVENNKIITDFITSKKFYNKSNIIVKSQHQQQNEEKSNNNNDDNSSKNKDDKNKSKKK